MFLPTYKSSSSYRFDRNHHNHSLNPSKSSYTSLLVFYMYSLNHFIYLSICLRSFSPSLPRPISLIISYCCLPSCAWYWFSTVISASPSDILCRNFSDTSSVPQNHIATYLKRFPHCTSLYISFSRRDIFSTYLLLHSSNRLCISLFISLSVYLSITFSHTHRICTLS